MPHIPEKRQLGDHELLKLFGRENIVSLLAQRLHSAVTKGAVTPDAPNTPALAKIHADYNALKLEIMQAAKAKTAAGSANPFNELYVADGLDKQLLSYLDFTIGNSEEYVTSKPLVDALGAEQFYKFKGRLNALGDDAIAAGLTDGKTFVERINKKPLPHSVLAQIHGTEHSEDGAFAILNQAIVFGKVDPARSDAAELIALHEEFKKLRTDMTDSAGEKERYTSTQLIENYAAFMTGIGPDGISAQLDTPLKNLPAKGAYRQVTSEIPPAQLGVFKERAEAIVNKGINIALGRSI